MAVTRHAVGHARIGAGDDDGVKGQAVGPIFIEPVDKLCAQVLFCHACADDLLKLRERKVRDLLRLAHELNFPRLLGCAEGIDLLLHRNEHRVQLLLELKERSVAHVRLFKAELFDRMLANDLVDARNVARTGMRHSDRKAGEVLFGGLNVAAVGKIVRALFCDHGNALGNTILRRIEPVILAR